MSPTILDYICRWHGYSLATKLCGLNDQILKRHLRQLLLAPFRPLILFLWPFLGSCLCVHLQALCAQGNCPHVYAQTGCLICTLRAPTRNFSASPFPKRSSQLPAPHLLSTSLLAVNLKHHSLIAISITVLYSQIPFFFRDLVENSTSVAALPKVSWQRHFYGYLASLKHPAIQRK